MGLVEDNTTEVKDLVIPGIQKERFRINGDNSKILELNTSDTNVLTRLNKAYPRLNKLAEGVAALGDVEGDTTEDELADLSAKLDKIDRDMRNEIDYIFDSNVCEVCMGDASVYLPKDGKFAWEHIIEAIGSLYEKSFTDELDKIKANVKKHTSKYTKSKKVKNE